MTGIKYAFMRLSLHLHGSHGALVQQFRYQFSKLIFIKYLFNIVNEMHF